jgi:hypothetical protein
MSWMGWLSRKKRSSAMWNERWMGREMVSRNVGVCLNLKCMVATIYKAPISAVKRVSPALRRDITGVFNKVESDHRDATSRGH